MTIKDSKDGRMPKKSWRATKKALKEDCTAVKVSSEFIMSDPLYLNLTGEVFLDDNDKTRHLTECWGLNRYTQSCRRPISNNQIPAFVPAKFDITFRGADFTNLPETIEIKVDGQFVTPYSPTTRPDHIIQFPLPKMVSGGSASTSNIAIKFKKDVEFKAFGIGYLGGQAAGIFGFQYPPDSIIGHFAHVGDITKDALDRNTYPGFAMYADEKYSSMLICEGTEIIFNVGKINSVADAALKTLPLAKVIQNVFDAVGVTLPSGPKGPGCDRRTRSRSLAGLTNDPSPAFSLKSPQTRIFHIENDSSDSTITMDLNYAQVEPGGVVCSPGVAAWTVGDDRIMMMSSCPSGQACYQVCEIAYTGDRRTYWGDYTVQSTGGSTCVTMHADDLDSHWTSNMIDQSSSSKVEYCTMSTGYIWTDGNMVDYDDMTVYGG